MVPHGAMRRAIQKNESMHFDHHQRQRQKDFLKKL